MHYTHSDSWCNFFFNEHYHINDEHSKVPLSCSRMGSHNKWFIPTGQPLHSYNSTHCSAKLQITTWHSLLESLMKIINPVFGILPGQGSVDSLLLSASALLTPVSGDHGLSQWEIQRTRGEKRKAEQHVRSNQVSIVTVTFQPVPLGRSLNLPEPQLPHLWNGGGKFKTLLVKCRKQYYNYEILCYLKIIINNMSTTI